MKPYLNALFKVICIFTVWLAVLVAFGIFTGGIK